MDRSDICALKNIDYAARRSESHRKYQCYLLTLRMLLLPPDTRHCLVIHLTHRLLLWFSSPSLLFSNACARFSKYGSVAKELQCLGAHKDDNIGVLIIVKAIDI